MTQKHFIAIAAIIKRRHDANLALYKDRQRVALVYTNVHNELRIHAHLMADYFASINPNFKRDRFMSACGFGD